MGRLRLPPIADPQTGVLMYIMHAVCQMNYQHTGFVTRNHKVTYGE
jgi:hypothetical protein